MGEAKRRGTKEERIKAGKIKRDLVIEEIKQTKLQRQAVEKQRIANMPEEDRRRLYNNRILIQTLMGSVDKWLE